MKGKISDTARVEHILEFVEEIETAIRGYDWEKFHDNHILRIAIVKWLENIGEAANHITEETKQNYPAVEWQKIIGLRNVVIHEYFRIDFKIIWDAAIIFLPQLRKEIETIKLN